MRSVVKTSGDIVGDVWRYGKPFSGQFQCNFRRKLDPTDAILDPTNEIWGSGKSQNVRCRLEPHLDILKSMGKVNKSVNNSHNANNRSRLKPDYTNRIKAGQDRRSIKP